MSPNEPHVSGGFRLLVIDDEPQLCEILQWDLEMAGHEVLVAHSGREGLELLARTPVDGIISDLRMPDGDGTELLKAVKEKSIFRPFVFFFTGDDEGGVADYFAIGAEAIVHKLHGVDDLLGRIERAVAISRGEFNLKSIDDGSAGGFEWSFSDWNGAQEVGDFSIGRGGMFLRTEHSVASVGQSISFLLRFSSGPVGTFGGRATVRWQRSAAEVDLAAGVGLEFDSLTEESAKTHARFISLHQPRAYIPLT